MKRLLLVVLAASATAFAADAPKPSFESIDATLEPGKTFEHCEKLAAGDVRRYSWKASGPVDFNIHYHEGTEAIYPMKRDGMRGDGGAFTPKTEQQYCWMWTARKARTRVEAQVETK